MGDKGRRRASPRVTGLSCRPGLGGAAQASAAQRWPRKPASCSEGRRAAQAGLRRPRGPKVRVALSLGGDLL